MIENETTIFLFIGFFFAGEASWLASVGFNPVGVGFHIADVGFYIAVACGHVLGRPLTNGISGVTGAKVTGGL